MHRAGRRSAWRSVIGRHVGNIAHSGGTTTATGLLCLAEAKARCKRIAFGASHVFRRANFIIADLKNDLLSLVMPSARY